MQNDYDELEARGYSAIVVAQEDDDLGKHARMADSFQPKPRFDVVADLNREVTTRWDRATIYDIDAEGVVRQVFPQTIHHRASWTAILRDIDSRKD